MSNNHIDEGAGNNAVGEAMSALSFATHYFSAAGDESIGELASFEEGCTPENWRGLTTEIGPIPSIVQAVDRTPPMNNSLKEYRSYAHGVQLEPILADFLGVSFLPFDDKLTKTKKTRRGQPGESKGVIAPKKSSKESNGPCEDHLDVLGSARSYSVTDDNCAVKHAPSQSVECDESTFNSCIEHHDDLDLILGAQNISPIRVVKENELEEPPATSREKKKRKKKKVGRAIKSIGRKIRQKHKNNEHYSISVATDSGKNGVVPIASVNGTLVTENGLLDTEANVTSCIARIRADEEDIDGMKADLNGIAEESKSLIKEAESISHRVQVIARNIADLEERLALSRKALEAEKDNLSRKVEELNIMDDKRQTVESTFDKIELSMEHRLNMLDEPPLRSSPPTKHENQSSMDGAAEKLPIGAKREGGIKKEGSENAAVVALEKRTEDESAELLESVFDERVEANEIVDKSARKAPRRTSSFIRIHDLQVNLPCEASASETNSTHSNFDLHDIGNSEHTGIIIDALAKVGYDCATDEGPRWTPIKETEQILAQRKATSWKHAEGAEILVWTGKFDHGGYGSDLPVVKARGNIRTNAKHLVELLLDSTRVKEYNKISQGRKDEYCFDRGQTEIDGEAKIVRSLSKPPMIKPIEMLSLLHARKLDGGCGEVKGYLVVSRSIWETCHVPPSAAANISSGDVNRSEMLLGVNLIRALDESSCEFTTVTHVSSSNVPMWIAKKVGLTAASNFIRDIKALYE